jgi:Mn2+/Fe2+ NRAMP family transporter
MKLAGNNTGQRCLRLLGAALLTAAIMSITGCALTRTVYVPAGEPVKLAAPIKDHPIWVTIDGKPVKTKMDIPEGWWALEHDEKK